MTTPLVVLALLVGLNLFFGGCVRRSELSRFQQNMVITLAWIVPFMGVFMGWVAMARASEPSRPENEEPLPALVAAAAPEVLARSGLPVFELRLHLVVSGGLPVLDWGALADWASRAAQPAEVRGASAAGRRAWLLHLRDACGDHFQLHEFEHALLLSSMENVVVRATAEYISTTRARIGTVLGGIARFPEDEKSVLFVPDSEDAYYRYVTRYYPDGDFAGSGGMFLKNGCDHFVVPMGDLAAIEPVIAHELTHSALAHLGLPNWLDEGLAVNTERRLCPWMGAAVDPRELKAAMSAFWGTEEIQQFWSGQSFFRPDEGSMLSYELARIIVDYLARDWTSFSAFVNSAERADAGGAAAQRYLGVSLGTLVSTLLERDSSAAWEPLLAPR